MNNPVTSALMLARLYGKRYADGGDVEQEDPEAQAYAPPPEPPAGEDVPGVGYVPSQVPAPIKRAGQAYLQLPSWMERAQEQSQKQTEAYQRSGVKGITQQLYEHPTESADLASGFVGSVTPAAKMGPNAVKYWSQAIADKLVETHGNNYADMTNAIANLDRITNPQVSEAIWRQLPDEARVGVLTHQINEAQQAQAAAKEKAPTLDEFFKHASPSQVEHLSTEELKSFYKQLRAAGPDWVEYHTKNPELFEALQQRLDDKSEHWAMEEERLARDPQEQDDIPASDKEIYGQETPQGQETTLDRLQQWYDERAGQPKQRVIPESHPNAPIYNGELITPSQFLSAHGASDVPRLTDTQLSHIGELLMQHQEMNTGTWRNIKDYYGDTLDALRNRIRERREQGTFGSDPEIRSIMDAISRYTTPSGTTEPATSVVRRPTPQPVPVDPGPFATLSSNFRDYFQRILSPFAKDVDELSQKMFAGQNTKSMAARVTQDDYHGWGQGFQFIGHIHTPGGERVGYMDRDIYPEAKLAYHGFFEASPEFKGSGIPAKILGDQIKFYKQIGLTHVRLTASLQSGPYSWLKYGWIPDKSNWNMIRREVQDDISRDHIHITDPDVKAEVLKILADDNPRRAWDLADIEAKDKHGNEIGKLAMLGHATKGLKSPEGGGGPRYVSKKNWSGSLLLNDAAVMARFNKYVSRKPTRKKAE